MLHGWKENLMLTNCLAACAHLTISVSEIEQDICEKNPSFYHTLLHSTPPLGGFPSEYQHPLWYGKTRMVSLPNGEKISKICLFVLTWSMNVTDGRTDTAWQQSLRLCIASHRAVKMLRAIVTNTHNTTAMAHRSCLAILGQNQDHWHKKCNNYNNQKRHR